MESDTVSCPLCGKPWLKVEGNKLICICGYIETVEQPTREELLKENEQLKKRIEELTQNRLGKAIKSTRTGL